MSGPAPVSDEGGPALLDPGGFSRKAVIKTVVLVASTCLVYLLLATRVEPARLLASLKRVDLLWAGVAAAIALAHNVLLVPERWRQVLLAMGERVGYGTALFAWVSGRPVMAVTPLRAGELIRAVYLWRQHGIAWERAVSSLVYDKFQVATAGALLLFLGSAFWPATAVKKVWTHSLLLSLGLAMGLTLFLLWSGRFGGVGARLGKLLPGKASALISKLLSALVEIRPFRRLLLLGLAVVPTLVEVAVMGLCLKAAGVEVGFGTLLGVGTFVLFVCQIPVTVSGLGTRETAIVLILAGYAGNDQLLAAGVLLSLVSSVVPTLVATPLLPVLLKRIVRNKQPA